MPESISQQRTCPPSYKQNQIIPRFYKAKDCRVTICLIHSDLPLLIPPHVRHYYVSWPWTFICYEDLSMFQALYSFMGYNPPDHRNLPRDYAIH